MKFNALKAFILITAVIITGCSNKISDVSTKIKTENIIAVGLGKSCIDNVCADGLECNEQQICVEKVAVKGLKCPTNQDPVCGLKNNTKNGYLNECEAIRHGAEVLYKGFCKKDSYTTNNCQAQMRAIGSCQTEFTGAEFAGGNCATKTVKGCDAEVPFADQKSCEKACMGGVKKNSDTKTVTELVSQGCKAIFDGCNNCTNINGGLACTKKFCEAYQEPRCLDENINNKGVQVCPDTKIINKMPQITLDGSPKTENSYFIYKGQRREISEFDLNWIKTNCKVQEETVY